MQAPPKQKQKTLETLREADETIVAAEDDVVADDEQTDEFAAYFQGKTKPKILLTTSYKNTKPTHDFIKELLETIPDSHFYARRNYQIKEIVEYAKNQDFTDIVVINEDNGTPSMFLQFNR
jgi:ribosome production factor 1